MRRRRVELGFRSETIRRANLSALVRELHIAGPLSRSELGARTGLSRSAIRLLTSELAGAGLVREENGSAAGTPGRPSAVVRLRPDGAAALALDVAVDSIAAALVGLGGQVLRHERVNRPREAFSLDQTTIQLVDIVDRLGRDARGLGPVVGVGVAFAGIVHQSDGVVAMAPNLGWRDVPLGQRLAAALDTPLSVHVANEADLGALAEHRRGAAVGVNDVLYISGEVGVGGGVIVDGRPLTGASGYAGEVGHMPLVPSGRRCGCGSHGCWETEIGERALLERAGYAMDGGRDAVDELIRDARLGSPRPLAALDHVGTWLGRGIAALTNVLNPSLVVLGGLFQRIYLLVERPLMATLNELALGPSARTVAVVPASLGIDAPLLGAAELAFEALLEDPLSFADTANQQKRRVVA